MYIVTMSPVYNLIYNRPDWSSVPFSVFLHVINAWCFILRHKSDPDLHQSVLQEELSNQMHVNTAATYPAMSLANMLHSHNSQQLSMSMNAQTFHVNKSGVFI